MMTKNYWKAFALLLCFSFTIIACDDDDPVTPDPTTPPAAPTNVQATSLSSTGIAIRWTASVDESNTNFAGYTITIADGTGAQVGDAQEVAAGINQLNVTDGLTAGTVYTFSIVARTDDDTESTTPATVSWSPAARYTMTLGGSIDLHEFASSLASGLQVYSAADGEPATFRVASPNNVNIDVVFDYRDADQKLLIGSPTASSFVSAGIYTSPQNQNPAKTTLIGKIWDDVAGFDEVFDSEALDATAMTDKMIDFTNKSGNFVFACKTSDSHYAKIMVHEFNGEYLQGSDPNRNITVTVSYQPVANVAFAKGN